MIINCYAVYDAKLSDYRLAIFDLEDGGAIRNFSDLIKDPNSGNWHKHPEDFSLWYVGKFDSRKGKLIPDNPVNLLNASAVIDLSAKPDINEMLKDKDKEPLVN